MASKQHTHTLARIPNEKGETRFKCTDPECSYVNTKKALKGKLDLCPYCAEEFVLKAQHLRLALPHCGCQKPKPIAEETAINFAENLLKDLK